MGQRRFAPKRILAETSFRQSLWTIRVLQETRPNQARYEHRGLRRLSWECLLLVLYNISIYYNIFHIYNNITIEILVALAWLSLWTLFSAGFLYILVLRFTRSVPFLFRGRCRKHARRSFTKEEEKRTPSVACLLFPRGPSFYLWLARDSGVRARFTLLLFLTFPHLFVFFCSETTQRLVGARAMREGVMFCCWTW